MHLELYANGTARFTGEVRNDTDPDQQFELDVFLQYRADYDEWTAQGRLPKDDLGLGAYVDWNYFEMVDTLSRLIGRGDFEGDMLYLDHMPTSRLFGFQMGVDGANNRNTNMGISGWFWYRGMIAGADVVGTGDINADLTNQENVEVACPVVEEYRRVRMAWSECGHDIHHNTIQRLDEETPAFLSIPALESADCTQLPDTPGVAAFDLFDACGGDDVGGRLGCGHRTTVQQIPPGPGHCPMLVRTAWTPFGHAGRHHGPDVHRRGHDIGLR